MIDWEKISLEISVARRLNLFKLTKVAKGSTVLFPSINIFWGTTDITDIVKNYQTDSSRNLMDSVFCVCVWGVFHALSDVNDSIHKDIRISPRYPQDKIA